MEPIRCVVFDIDDTLYLEQDYVRSGFRVVDLWVQKELGLRGFFEAAWRSFCEGTRGTIFDEALDCLGVEPVPALLARLVPVYRRHRPQIELLPDADRCLEQLSGRAPIGLVTDGPMESQRAKLEALGLRHRVDGWILTAELGVSKPNPFPFKLIEHRLGASAETCIYVADNPDKDFQGPKQRGWHTLRIRRSGGLHASKPSDGHVDAEMTDLSALPQMVLSRTSGAQAR